MNVLEYTWTTGCPGFDEEACVQAAAGNQLNALKYLRTVYCPWDSKTISTAERLGRWL